MSTKLKYASFAYLKTELLNLKKIDVMTSIFLSFSNLFRFTMNVRLGRVFAIPFRNVKCTEAAHLCFCRRRMVVLGCLCPIQLSLCEFGAGLRWQMTVGLVVVAEAIVSLKWCSTKSLWSEQRGRRELQILVYFILEKSDNNWSKLGAKIRWHEKRNLALTVSKIQYGIFFACEKKGLKGWDVSALKWRCHS